VPLAGNSDCRELRFKMLRLQGTLIQSAPTAGNSNLNCFDRRELRFKLFYIHQFRFKLFRLQGTPIQNNTEELWCLLHFLSPLGFADRE